MYDRANHGIQKTKGRKRYTENVDNTSKNEDILANNPVSLF